MIYVIRHAESAPMPGRQPAQYPLTPAGHASARQLVALLAGLDIAHIYSSPYQRAVDTIAPFARSAGLGWQLDHELRERDLAPAPLPSPQAHVAAVRRCWEDFDFRLPGGESNRECQRRATAAMWRLHERHDAERVAVASHGQWTSLLLNALDPDFGVEDWLVMGMPAVFQVDLEAPAWRAIELSQKGA